MHVVSRAGSGQWPVSGWWWVGLTLLVKYLTTLPTQKLVDGSTCAHANGHVWSREGQAHAPDSTGVCAWEARYSACEWWVGGAGQSLTLLLEVVGHAAELGARR